MEKILLVTADIRFGATQRWIAQPSIASVSKSVLLTARCLASVPLISWFCSCSCLLFFFNIFLLFPCPTATPLFPNLLHTEERWVWEVGKRAQRGSGGGTGKEPPYPVVNLFALGD